MKNFIVFTMAVTCLGIFNACEKDEHVLIDEQPQVAVNDPMFAGLDSVYFSVEDNRLVFESEKELQKCIDFLAQLGDENFAAFEKEIGFESYRKIFKDNPEKSELFPDELFQTILNPEMEAIVGKYLLREDPVNQKTYAYELNSTNGNLKSGIVNEYEFSSDDDIFALLKGEPGLKSSGCSRKKLGYYRWNTSEGTVNYKLVYQTGFVKSLQAKIKKSHSRGGVYIDVSTAKGVRNYWKNKDSKPEGTTINNRNRGGRSNRVYNIRPYYKTKKLYAYYYKVNFYCSDANGGVYSKSLTISCN